jgi:transposase InsO family protein
LKCEEVISQTKPRNQKLAKLHKYFAHASAESLWRLIKNSSNPDAYTQTEVATACDKCPTCQVHKRRMPKKKTSLPRSTAFNQVVCIDLKCHSDGSYVLWIVDDATRLIAGHVIKNKQPETIISALDTAWITGHGKGPGLPEKYFLADNGREFVNEKLLDLMQAAGITLKTTASYSPTMNGMNERNHGVADKIVEKLRHDDPDMTLQDAVDKASWAKNTLINNQRGFSPFQIIYGHNQTIPGISDSTTGSLENLTHNEISRKIIESMQTTRLQMLASEYDHRIRVAIKDRLPKSTNFKYEVGNQVVFKDAKDGKMHDARIVGIDGPVAILRWGNSERRAQLRELLPSREINLLEEDSEGEEEDETELTEIIPEIIPRYRSKHRSDKEWIIPEISEREVVKMMKAQEPLEDSETDNTPRLEVWTDEDNHIPPGSIKIDNLPRPARYEWIELCNEHGEKFQGKVTGYRKTNPNFFYIILAGTNIGQWIDLNKLNYWEYCDPPDLVGFFMDQE